MLKRRFILSALIGLVVLIALIGTSTPVRAIPIASLGSVRVPVLMYHYISTPPPNADATLLDLAVTPGNFHAQMKYLSDHGYHTITPGQLAAALIKGVALPSKPVMVTFDDGYEDAFTNAFPTLKEFGFTGTFFIVTGFIDSHNPRYLTWDQVKQMSAAGMTIGDHSRTHQSMVGRNHAWLVNEIDKTRDEIKTQVGISPLYFCYPYGTYDGSTLREIQAAGFVEAFTTHGSTFERRNQMLTLPRVRVHGSTTLLKFAALMNWNQ